MTIKWLGNPFGVLFYAITAWPYTYARACLGAWAIHTYTHTHTYTHICPYLHSECEGSVGKGSRQRPLSGHGRPMWRNPQATNRPMSPGSPGTWLKRMQLAIAFCQTGKNIPSCWLFLYLKKKSCRQSWEVQWSQRLLDFNLGMKYFYLSIYKLQAIVAAH